MDKQWYLSKTVWINVLAIIAVVFGEFELNAETQVAILSVINLVLRLVTKEKLNW